MISKYRLLGVALHAIHKDIHHHSINQQWRTYFSWAILSYMRSDSFTGRSFSHSEYSVFKGPFWTCRAYALACMASLMDPEDRVIEWKVEWAKKLLFLNILEVIQDERIADAPPLPAALFILDERVAHALPLSVVRFIQDERVADTFPLPAIRVILPTPQRVDSIIGVVGWLLDQAFRQRIPGAYEAFREKGSLRYIEEKSTLYPELIELLRGYITGLSDAKVGNLQSVEFFDQHIKDLHQAPVIHCICASIARSGIPPRSILSTLASIAPYDNEWPDILQTLNSLGHEYSVQCYTLHPADDGTRNDVRCWKKEMKGIVNILAECLKKEKGRNTNINISNLQNLWQSLGNMA
ncbi:hypothetical protein EDD85DRAFT_855742 [Armillaria nabsnona]|nr:hypothetical protein EDD85DRAFT_855742 [Armillaria nabsnona]